MTLLIDRYLICFQTDLIVHASTMNPVPSSAINNTTLVASTKLQHPTIILPTGQNNCILSAIFNQQRIYNKQKLHLKCGSFGLGGLKDQSIWWEWGNPDWTTAEQFTEKQSPGKIDAHVWLEDENGNIWDVWDPQLWGYFDLRRLPTLVRVKLGAKRPKNSVVIEGWSYSKCAQLGFHYKVASKDVCCAALKMYQEHYNASLKELDLDVSKVVV